MGKRLKFSVVSPVAGLFLTAVLAAAPAATAPDFDRDIRPILSDKCFACHGPDEKNRMAGLRLDLPEGALGERGARPPVVIPGQAAASLLYQRISADKPAARMPPPRANLNLSDEEIEKVRAWIDSGAKWETHWSYRVPKPPEKPAVSDPAWPKNPIDSFVLARLDKENLKPAPPADKITLLRRVTFDLTGLPPTPAEVDAFVKDNSPDAYETVIERLLASPHYGEKMAMPWLDLARYSDTHGYHIDSVREMWHWRDWVIRAFNANKPFDKFIVEQLAGDLLPQPTNEQLTATGFNRNHMINFEGGAIPEEYQTEYVIDRVETTSVVFLGMTMGCARCHDHKYDPIKQKDFYRFFAFFNTIPEKGLDGQNGNAMPFLKLPTPEQRDRVAALKSEIARLKEDLPEAGVDARVHDWELTAARTLPPVPERGLTHYFPFEKSLEDPAGKTTAKAVRGDLVYNKGRMGQSAEFSGETQVSLAEAGQFDRKSPFSVAVFLKLSKRYAHAILEKLDPETGRGWDLWTTDAELVEGRTRAAQIAFRMRSGPNGKLLSVRTRDRLLLKGWRHLAVTYDGSGKASGVRIYFDGKPQPLEVLADKLPASIATGAPLMIGDKSSGAPYKGGMDDLRFYSRALSLEEVDSLAIHTPARALAAVDPLQRDCGELAELREYYLEYQAPAQERQEWAHLKSLEKQLEETEKEIPSTMVMREMKDPRETFILARGDYRNKTERVEPGVPSSLPPLPADAPRNRLGLAEWIVSPSNPLTARVTVNRFWQNYFGTGIVETAEDFGSQGAAPSHPELLDWLATEFVRSGWDVKAMQRLIVTSATYRQSSVASPHLIETDPQNRLLARGPRFRLPAELVRDNALAVSGLLNSRVGGASVFPYQPPGLWEEMAYGDGFTGQEYHQSHGEDLYRRSLYTFWKRTVPPPALATFDAPDREKCTARRARTNTPLQALVLMNDPTYVEAARALAERVIHTAGHDPRARVETAFQLATAREPEAKEIQVLRDLAEQEAVHFRRDPQAAKELLSVGESKPDAKLDPAELATWTTVASAILNLDETITKE